MMPLVPTNDHLPPQPPDAAVREALAVLLGPLADAELGRLDFAYGHNPVLHATATATALWRTAARVLMDAIPFGSTTDDPTDAMRTVAMFTDAILGRDRLQVMRQYTGEWLFAAETMRALSMVNNGLMNSTTAQDNARCDPLIDAAAAGAGATSKALHLAFTQLRDADKPEPPTDTGPPEVLTEAVQLADYCQRALVAWAYPRGYVTVDDEDGES